MGPQRAHDIDQNPQTWPLERGPRDVVDKYGVEHEPQLLGGGSHGSTLGWYLIGRAVAYA
ncbi:hypothetical protein ACQPW3_34810 [Actinosynnema sp. CA-248983]